MNTESLEGVMKPPHPNPLPSRERVGVRGLH